ncbi:MAG: HAD-IA family hydrolase [Ignavibacteriota bacterium]
MDLLIFDLDGTLVDSRLDLANAVNAMREHLGMSQLTNERVYTYVGNGAQVLVRKSLGEQGGEDLFQTGYAFFMEYYGAHDLDFTTLYPTVRESLDRFRDAGKRMAVLTNKPSVMTHHILEGLGVSGHFFRMFGGDSLAQRKPDPIGVEMLMQEAGVDRAHTMMVGDSSVDVATARNAGIACCGVTYGFQPESLADPAPQLLVDRMEQFADWLLKK